jgi:hypothetical protein
VVSSQSAARWSARAFAVALAAGALVLPAVASASQAPAQTAAQAQVAQIQQEMHNHTLVAKHGVMPACPQCQAEVVTTSPGSGIPINAATPTGYGPSTLLNDYHITGTGSTNTIAIIDAGVDPDLAADLAAYRTQYSLPACTVANGCLSLKNYTGGAQPAPQTSIIGKIQEKEISVETALDVDMASAACPTCHILELSVPLSAGTSDSSTSTGYFASAVNEAVTLGAKAVSISYGYTESATNTSGTQLNAFNHPGVAITVSTGDSGFNGGTHQDWPSDLPYAIASGGTTLTSATNETAWSGGGSGCETVFTAANGQPAADAALCNGHRTAADVASDADPNTGVSVYNTYSSQANGWITVGGTSAAAPFLGGLFARAGVPSTLLGPNTLYAAAASNFHDITSGSNNGTNKCSSFPSISPKVCTAAAGYDGPTGLGSPNGVGAF